MRATLRQNRIMQLEESKARASTREMHQRGESEEAQEEEECGEDEARAKAESRQIADPWMLPYATLVSPPSISIAPIVVLVPEF